MYKEIAIKKREELMNQQQRENKNSNFLKNSSHFNLKNNQQDQLKSKRRHSWKGYSNKRKTQYIVSVADQRFQFTATRPALYKIWHWMITWIHRKKWEVAEMINRWVNMWSCLRWVPGFCHEDKWKQNTVGGTSLGRSERCQIPCAEFNPWGSLRTQRFSVSDWK